MSGWDDGRTNPRLNLMLQKERSYSRLRVVVAAAVRAVLAEATRIKRAVAPIILVVVLVLVNDSELSAAEQLAQ